MKALVKPYGQVGLSYVTDAAIPDIGPRDILARASWRRPSAAATCTSTTAIPSSASALAMA